jgi:methylmalonyl-CoA mutase N-terminal domain/subunit
MTDEIETAAKALMDRVQELGGAVAAIERGFQKSEIERSAYDVARQIDDGDRVVVGVNRFGLDDEEHYQPLRVDPSIEVDQRARLERLRAERDQAEVDRRLAELVAAASTGENVLYSMREALRARGTVGEVSDALRSVWGVYQPADSF